MDGNDSNPFRSARRENRARLDGLPGHAAVQRASPPDRTPVVMRTREPSRLSAVTAEPLPPSGTYAKLDRYEVVVEGGEIWLAPERVIS